MNLPSPQQNNEAKSSAPITPSSKEGRTLRLNLLALVSTGLAWFALLLPLPWKFLGAIPTLGLMACIILLPFFAWGTKLQKRSFVTAALYVIPALFSAVMLIFSLIFYTPLKTAEECQANALTQQAQQECQQLLPGN